MNSKEFKLDNLLIRPLKMALYLPPIVWKGDPVGHIGKNDVFFWVLEGECYLTVDSSHYIIRPGQLAYLPAGKMRSYTHVSENFVMYEMAFSVTSNGSNIMDILGLSSQNLVVDITEKDEMSQLFKTSHHIELFKDPLYDVTWCGNLVKIISTYAEERKKLNGKDISLFAPVLDYMAQNTSSTVNIETLSSLMYMQPTYFIRKFHNCFGMPPMTYFTRMKMYKAMSMLAGTSLSIEEIARELGISDVSYFSRLFKKHCLTTPKQYRAAFKVG